MATRNLVPRGNNEGSLGIDGQRWSALHVASISTDTLKVTNIQLKANDNLSLFTKGAGIEDISTNDSGQFVISIDDVFLSSLGYNADGTKPDFAANGTVLAGDSFVSAINKLDAAVSNVADPTNLDTTNFTADIIDTDLSAVSASDDTLASAKAIKTYVDAQVTAQDLDFQGDAGGALSIDLDSQTLTIAGGAGLTSTGADQTLTLSLDDTAVTPGAYGSATAIPTFTVDQQGRLTAAGTAAITTSFTLAADAGADDTFNNGGTLTFTGDTGITTTVSDDTITIDLDDTAVTAGSYGSATAIPTFTVDQQGRLTAAGTVGITTTLTVDSDNDGTQDVSLAADDLQIKGGTGLTSSIAKADNEVTVTLALDNTAVAAATYGDANSVGQFTVDAQGRLTGAASVDIEIPKGQVTNFDEEVQDLVGAQLVTNGSHTGISAAYDDNGDGAIDLTVSGLTLTEFAASSIQTEDEVSAGGGAAGFGDNDTSLLTAAAIKQFIDSQNFGTGSGDISRVNITAGTGLSGSTDTTSGDHTQTITLADTAVTAASYGSVTQVPTFTVDQQGRLTAAANANIAIASTSVTDFSEAVQDIAGAQLVTNGTHAGISAVYDDNGDGAVDLTVSAGTSHIQDEAITAAKLNTDIISGQTELAAGLASTDELLVSDAGTVKRMDASVLQDYMQNNLTFTTNTDVDVTKANLSTRLATFDAGDTLNIGDADNDTNVVIRGNLTVQGLTTTVNSTTISVDDKNIELGSVANPTDITADGGGITLKGDADKTILFENDTAAWEFSEHIVLANNKEFKIDNDQGVPVTVLNATALGTSVISSSLTSVGTLTELQVDNININGNTISSTAGTDLNITPIAGQQIVLDDTIVIDAGEITGATSITSTSLTGALTGNADTATKLAATKTIAMTGDVVWTSAAFDGSANVTGTSTLQDGAITLAKIDIINDSAITNAKLANSSVSFGGVSVTLGSSDDTPAFDLQHATGLPTTSLTGTITNAQLAGSIADGKLASDYIQTSEVDGSSIEFDSGSLNVKALGVTNAMLAGSIADGKLASDYIQTSEVDGSSIEFDSGSLNVKALGVTNAMLAGSIADGKLASDYIQTSEVDGSSIEFDSGSLNVKALGITNAMLAGSIADSKLSQITTANKIAVSAIDLNGATAQDNPLIAADLILVDDGAAGTNRKATLTQLVAFFQNNSSLTSLNALTGVGTIGTGTWQGTAIADAYVANDLTIIGGTVNNSVIGGSTAAAGTFTNLVANTDLTINSTTTVTQILDEDNMASNSATSLATQQSIKKYVDDQITAQDLDFATDTGSGGTVDLDSQSLTIQGTTNKVGVTHSGQTITVNVGSDIVQLDETQTLTNKTLTSPTVSGLSLSDASIIFEGATSDDFETTLSVEDPTADRTVTIPNATDTLVGRATTDTLTNKSIDVDNNTITNIEVDNLKAGVLDTDLSSVAETDTTLASAKAIKAYVDDQLGRFGGIFKTDKANDNGKEIVTTRSQALGIDYDYTRDVIFEASPIVRSHFGPFAYSLKDLRDSAGDQGSDIIFFGATSTGASDRHFLVIGSGSDKGDTKFTGAHEETP